MLNLTTAQSERDSLNCVQRISLHYESKCVTPRSPVPQKKVTTPREEPKKVDLSSKVTLINELNSKLKARKEIVKSISNTTDSKDTFFEAEFSPFPEIEPGMLVRSLLDQIKLFSEFSMLKADERCHFQSLLRRLGNSITLFEQSHEKRFLEMKTAQDSSFAEIFIKKNEELTKLRSEIANLNKLKKVASPQLKCELNAAKDEVQRLNGTVQKQNDEINKLSLDLLSAQSYIESLERTKLATQSIELNEQRPNIQLANEHFKTIKQALLANRSLLKAIQMKKADKLNQHSSTSYSMVQVNRQLQQPHIN